LKNLGKRWCVSCRKRKDLRSEFYLNYKNGDVDLRKSYNKECIDCSKIRNSKKGKEVKNIKGKKGEYWGGKLIRKFDDEDNVISKYCNFCSEWLDLDKFSINNKNIIDGRNNICLKCVSKKNSERLKKKVVVEKRNNFDYKRGVLIRKRDKKGNLINKRCGVCFKWKDLNFGKDKYSRDGFSYRCIDCKKNGNVIGNGRGRKIGS
jgi:hypothetical protein